MASSVYAMTSQPAALARSYASSNLSRLPCRSPTVRLSWASATRTTVTATMLRVGDLTPPGCEWPYARWGDRRRGIDVGCRWPSAGWGRYARHHARSGDLALVD